MNKTLYQIFHDKIETLLYILDIEKDKYFYIENSLSCRIDLVKKYLELKLLSDKDIEYLNSPFFYNSLLNKGYASTISTLDLYLNNIKYELKYIKSLIYNYNDHDEIERFLLKIEKRESKKYVIDLLSQIEPSDVNENKDLDFIDCFTVLKYIGNNNDLKKQFKIRINSFIFRLMNPHLRFDIYDICEDYINTVLEYFTYVPECEEIYIKLKFLLNNYQEYYENDENDDFIEDILNILNLVNCDNYKIFTHSDEIEWQQSMYLKWENLKMEFENGRQLELENLILENEIEEENLFLENDEEEETE